MRLRFTGTALVIGSIVAGVACGSSDRSKRVAGDGGEDAGPDVIVSGAGGKSGTGGRSGTGGAATGGTGTGGTTTTVDASVDASPDVSTDAHVEAEASMDAADGALRCPPVPRSSLPDPPPTADSGATDAGSVKDAGDDLVSRWRDWGANTCQVCPAPAIGCHDFIDTPGTKWDATTKEIILQLAPGKAEIVSATFEFLWQGTGVDGGFQSTRATLEMAVDGDTLRGSLAGVVQDLSYILSSTLTLTDACGNQTVIQYDIWTTTPLNDAGVQYVDIACES